MTIDILPDDALLETFIFYLEEAYKADSADPLEAWHALVHVCQRWRRVVFASPRRLNLRLVCTSRKPVREMLDIWPTLPIVIQDWDLDITIRKNTDTNAYNIVAALEHCDRVHQIALGRVPFFLLEKGPIMMEFFPELTHLSLLANSAHWGIYYLPDSFLGGSAPLLRELALDGIAFPALPKLLSSTNNLVELSLWCIPHSGYISPEAMVTCLSSLTRLENFSLGFNRYDSRPDEFIRRPPPLTRVNLPALLKFRIHGVNKYIEDFVARINAPLLFEINTSYFNHVRFEMAQFSQFIDRTEYFKALRQLQARVQLSEIAALIKFGNAASTATLELRLPFLDARHQPLYLAVLCRSLQSPITPSVKRLDIVVGHPPPRGWNNVYVETDIYLWFGILELFTEVKDLYLSEGLALRVLRAVQGLIDEDATQALPALRNIFVEGHDLSDPVYAAIGPFIAVRQNSGHRITVRHWDRREENDE